MSAINKKKFIAPIRSKPLNNTNTQKDDNNNKTAETVATNSVAPILPLPSDNIEDVEYLHAADSLSVGSVVQNKNLGKSYLPQLNDKDGDQKKQSHSNKTFPEKKRKAEDVIENDCTKEHGSLKKSPKRPFLGEDGILEQPNVMMKMVRERKTEDFNGRKKKIKPSKGIPKSSSLVHMRPNTIARSQNLSQSSKKMSHYERLIRLQNLRGNGLWVQCDNKKCEKWRYLADVPDPTVLPEKWFCNMNTDKDKADCSAPFTVPSPSDEEDMIHNTYTAGSLVWARFADYPHWPAMVDDCPDTEVFYWLNGFSDIPTYYNVVFFDTDPVTRAWIKPSKLYPFVGKITLKSNEIYKKRLEGAMEIASKAKKLTIKDRLRKYSFLALYKGPIITPLPMSSDSDDDSDNTMKQTSILKNTFSGKTASLPATEYFAQENDATTNLNNSVISTNMSHAKQNSQSIKVIGNKNTAKKYSDESKKLNCSASISDKVNCDNTSDVDASQPISTNSSLDLFDSQLSEKNEAVNNNPKAELPNLIKINIGISNIPNGAAGKNQGGNGVVGRMSLSQPSMGTFYSTVTMNLEPQKSKSNLNINEKISNTPLDANTAQSKIITSSPDLFGSQHSTKNGAVNNNHKANVMPNLIKINKGLYSKLNGASGRNVAGGRMSLSQPSAGTLFTPKTTDLTLKRFESYLNTDGKRINRELTSNTSQSIFINSSPDLFDLQPSKKNRAVNNNSKTDVMPNLIKINKFISIKPNGAGGENVTAGRMSLSQPSMSTLSTMKNADSKSSKLKLQSTEKLILMDQHNNWNGNDKSESIWRSLPLNYYTENENRN